MRSVTSVALALLSLALDGPQPTTAAPGENGAYHIVVPRRDLGAGEIVELRFAPPPPDGARVNFGMMIGTMGIGFPDGIYRAPYVIPPRTPPVRISGSFSADGFRASATTEIELLPGSVPGAEDCLGPGQSFSTVMAEIEPGDTYVDELPELIQRVEPNYPKSASVRGIEDTIGVKALVCRSGRVLDAVALSSYRNSGTGLEPIGHDPKLVEAAVAAVRQYVFSPALKSGQGVAVWVHTAVIFRR